MLKILAICVGKKRSKSQLSFYSTLEEQLNHTHPLYILSKHINRLMFEEKFAKHYSENFGAPAKPIRLMVGLLVFKHNPNLSDERVVKKLSLDQRFRNHPKNQTKARKADRKIKTIAGRLVRETDRKLQAAHPFRIKLALFEKVLAQKRDDKQKIYSLHEPHVQCIGKGKEHKKYEMRSIHEYDLKTIVA